MDPSQINAIIFVGTMLTLSIGLTGAGIWNSMYRNRQTVDVRRREALVIQNVITGELDVLWEGTHPLPPWWKKHTMVDLNRRRYVVEGLVFVPGPKKGGMYYHYEFSFALLSGRQFNPTTGQLTDYNPLTGQFTTLNAIAFDGIVTKENIILAATAIDYEHRVDEVKHIVKPVIDEELGNLTTDDLSNPGGPHYGATLRRTALLIDARCDLNTTHLGQNTLAGKIEDLRPASEADQHAFGAHVRADQFSEGAKAAVAAAGGEEKLSYPEALALVLGDGSFGETAKAGAYRYAADRLKEGAINWGSGA